MYSQLRRSIRRRKQRCLKDDALLTCPKFGCFQIDFGFNFSTQHFSAVTSLTVQQHSEYALESSHLILSLTIGRLPEMVYVRPHANALEAERTHFGDFLAWRLVPESALQEGDTFGQRSCHEPADAAWQQRRICLRKFEAKLQFG